MHEENYPAYNSTYLSNERIRCDFKFISFNFLFTSTLKLLQWGKQNLPKMSHIKVSLGSCHSLVDPTAPNILRPGFKSQAQHLGTLCFFQFKFALWFEKDKNKQKKHRLTHMLKVRFASFKSVQIRQCNKSSRVAHYHVLDYITQDHT